MSLTSEELAERVADVDHPDIGRPYSGTFQRVLDGLREQVGDIQPLAHGVAGEVGLVTADHRRIHALITTTNRVDALQLTE
jgi:hypothetical protein